MNKFKHLQIVGTLTVLSPIILVIGAILIFWATLASKPEVVEEVVEVEKPDTVIAVQETKLVPVVVKPAPVVKPTPVPPPVPVVKDTVKPVVESLDTAK
jgi:hypothetical protein